MIIKTSNVEAAALALHMIGMRKSFRNILKAKYKHDKDKYLKSYDYVIAQAKYQLEQHIDQYDMHLNIVDMQVLSEFLRAYTAKIESQLSSHLNEHDKAAMQMFLEIHEKCQLQLDDVS